MEHSDTKAAAAGTGSVAVVTVNYRTPELAIRCVRSLEQERASLPDLRVVLCDGGSGDGSAETLIAGLADTADWVTVLALPINGGFGWANNQAMLRLLQAASPPEFILLLNPDSEVEPGAVAALRDELVAHPECAVAGSQLLNPDGREEGSAFHRLGIASELSRGARSELLAKLKLTKQVVLDPGVGGEVDWVTGASFMVRSEALRQVGLFDDGFFLYFEEIELMHRLRASGGWTIRHVPASRVWHVGGAATGVNSPTAPVRPRPRYWFESRRRFFTRAGGSATAVAASVAWIAGSLLWGLRRALTRAPAKDHVPGELRDLFKIGLLPTARDRTPEVTPWDEPPGRPPAWMEKG